MSEFTPLARSSSIRQAKGEDRQREGCFRVESARSRERTNAAGEKEAPEETGLTRSLGLRAIRELPAFIPPVKITFSCSVLFLDKIRRGPECSRINRSLDFFRP